MDWTSKTTKIESLVLCALCIVMPAGSVVAGDGEDPAPKVTPGSPEAAQDANLTLDFDAPHDDSPRPDSVRAAHATTPDGEEHRSDLSLELGSVLLGALQDTPQQAPAASGSAEAAKGGSDLSAKATNPVAALIQLQFQNTWVGESNAGSGNSNVFVIQPVAPWKLGELAMITRITLPLLVATPDLGDPIGREYGLGDTVALNAMVFNIKEGFWKGMMGPMLTVTLPTASSDFTGSGKWQAGPGFIYINLANKGLQWGIMGYQQWSFASTSGDNGRDEISKLFFQPILTKHFEGGWYLGLQDILWSYDFNDEKWSFPTGPRFGRVTKLGNTPVNIFIEPFYDWSWQNPGDEWGIKLNLTLLFPK